METLFLLEKDQRFKDSIILLIISVYNQNRREKKMEQRSRNRSTQHGERTLTGTVLHGKIRRFRWDQNGAVGDRVRP